MVTQCMIRVLVAAWRRLYALVRLDSLGLIVDRILTNVPVIHAFTAVAGTLLRTAPLHLAPFYAYAVLAGWVVGVRMISTSVYLLLANTVVSALSPIATQVYLWDTSAASVHAAGRVPLVRRMSMSAIAPRAFM
eukprot:SAG25_NODE_6425_length_560_cov_2.587852_1_plen_133_part_10